MYGAKSNTNKEENANFITGQVRGEGGVRLTPHVIVRFLIALVLTTPVSVLFLLLPASLFLLLFFFFLLSSTAWLSIEVGFNI